MAVLEVVGLTNGLMAQIYQGDKYKGTCYQAKLDKSMFFMLDTFTVIAYADMVHSGSMN